MRKKGLISILVFAFLLSSSLIFASNLDYNFTLEEIESDDRGHFFNWELKDDLEIGSYITLKLDLSLEDYSVEKDDFIELEMDEDSKQVKLIFIQDLEKGQKGSISFLKKEKDIEKTEAPLVKRENTCPICDKKLEIIDDGRAVCICEEAVIIDFDDMPLKGDQEEKKDEDLTEEVDLDRGEDKDNLEISVEKTEEAETSNGEEVNNDVILDNNPQSLPNTGFGGSYIYLGVVFLIIGLYYKKKLILK